jgi:hypothetical protein
MQQEDNTTLLKAFGSFKSLRFSASLCFLFQTFGKLMLPSRRTNLGEPNGEIGISNSVAANLWCQLRQAYGHIHTIKLQ